MVLKNAFLQLRVDLARWVPLKENMLLDVNQEIITPRVPRFSAELNVENLCGKQITQLKVLIANPNGRIDSHCFSTTKRANQNMRDHLTFD